MIPETHIDPDNAWSDNSPQVTPQALDELPGRLILRQTVSHNSKFPDLPGELRGQIDIFDDQPIELMEQRMNVSETFSSHKKVNNITKSQNQNWEEIISKVLLKGKSKGLNE